MITKLKLKNFRQHADSEIEFVSGVNTIVGSNNSGKSTIPEAIEFALYGSRALRDNAKGYIRDGCSDGSAVVKLSLGDDELTVGRNTKNAEVRLNGKLEARYKGNVSEYIGTATGVSQVGFRLGHYIRQKELSYFSGLRPGKRYELIEKMLKINAVDVAIKNIKKQVAEADIGMRVLLSKFADIPALQVQLDDLSLGLESEKNQEESLKKDLTDLRAILKEQRKELLDLQHIPEYNSVVLELVACDTAKLELDKLKKELVELGALDETVFTALYKKLKELTLEEQARQDLLNLEVLYLPKEVEAAVAVDRTEYIKITAQLSSALTAHKKLLALDQDSPCPTCGQTLKEEYSTVLSAAEYAVSLLEGQEKDIAITLMKEEEQYQHNLLAYKAYTRDMNAWLRYSEQLEELSTRCTDSYSKQDKEKITKELAAYNEAKETRAALNASIVELQKSVNKLPALTARALELDFVKNLADNPGLTILIKENEKVELTLNEAFTKVTKQLAFLASSILGLQARIKEAKEVGKEVDALAMQVSELKSYRDSFILFKRYLTSKIRPMLETVASTLFHKTTKNRYAGYNLSEDYDISLTTHEGYSRKLSSISGSENDLASLCLRLAIATLRSTKLAGSLGFIILDEISGSFDDERTKQTLEGLLELKEVIPQIINITHKPVEMKYADRLFTVTEKNAKACITHL